MEIKILAKNTVILAGPKVFKFLIGLLKSKFIAVFLGVTGYGIVEQLNNTISQIKNISLTLLPHGMVKLIAENNAKEFNANVIYQIIKTYFAMVLPLAVVMTVLGYFFSSEITIFVFGDIKYKMFFLIGFTAVPITIISTSYRAFFKAFKEIKTIALAEFIIIIANLILFLPLIYFFGLLGGIVYATLSFFVTCIVIVHLVQKNVFKKYGITYQRIIHATFSKLYFKELLSFIGVGIVIGLFRVFENITIRSIVVNDLGIDKLGVYTPITKWSTLIVGFILPSVFTYLYPRLSEAKDNEDITSVVNDVFRLLTFSILPFIIVGISTRQWIIPLFFSNDFIDASIYLPYHFVGLLIVVWSTILEQIFAPTGRLRALTFFVIILSLSGLILSYYFIPIYGLYGYMTRFTLIPILTLIIYVVFWKNKINFVFKIENLKLLFYSILCCILLLLMKDLNVFIQLFSFFLIPPLYFLLNEKEKKYFLRKLKIKR